MNAVFDSIWEHINGVSSIRRIGGLRRYYDKSGEEGVDGVIASPPFWYFPKVLFVIEAK